MKKRFKIVYLLWLSIPFLLWWSVRTVSFDHVIKVLSTLRVWQILLLLAINIGILLLFSARWWFILRSMGQTIRYYLLAFYRMAGFSISYFTPGMQFGGEPLQIYLLKHRHKTPAAQAISSVILDKLFEFLANFIFLLIGLITIAISGYFPGRFQSVPVAMALFILIFPLTHLLLLKRGVYPFNLLAVKAVFLGTRWPGVQRILALLVQTEADILEFFQEHPVAVGQAVFISAVTWAAMIFEYGLMLKFLGVSLSLTQTVSVLTAARLAFLIPVPGGLGVLEASQIFALQALGYPPALGLSLSLLIRARDIFVGLAGIMIGFWASKRSPLIIQYS